LNAPTIMLAEKAADHILGGACWRPTRTVLCGRRLAARAALTSCLRSVPGAGQRSPEGESRLQELEQRTSPIFEQREGRIERPLSDMRKSDPG